MTGYVDPFGGSSLQASQVSYAAVTFAANLLTYWPAFAVNNTQPLARLMECTPDASNLIVYLPDALLVTPGQDVFIMNMGSVNFTVADFEENSVAVIAPGEQRYMYLTDTQTSAGVWRTILMGVGAAANDASQMAGRGLTAVGQTLNQTSLVTEISVNTTFSATDLASVFVNTGGAITGSLPLLSATATGYFVEVRNQGTGAFTIDAAGSDSIDGSASIALQLNESCFVHAGPAGWYTVGRGRNSQFGFTQLQKSVNGGTTTLSLSEASNVVQTYTGVLLSNETVVLPAVVQVYYVFNSTSGAFSLTLSSPTPGTTLSIPTGQSAVVFCDGVNVVNASTSVGGIASLLLNAGSVGAPSLGVAATNNGLYAPTSTSLAVTANGVQQVRWDGGQTLVGNGTVGLPSYSFSLSAGTGFYSPAADQLAVATGSTQRLLFNGTAATPGADNTQTFGSGALRWASVYATSFVGALTGNATNVTGIVAMANGGTGAATASAARTALSVAPRATRIDVASVAGTVDITTNAPDTDDIRITGVLAITAFTIAVGRVLRVTAAAAFTLTNNANIVTQRGTSIVCAAGDTFMLRATAANTVEVLNYVSSSVVVVRAYNSVSTAMATAVFTLIEFQTEVEDTAGVFAANRLTATIAGDYMISAAYQPGAPPTACTMSIYKNGARHSDGCITSDTTILCSSTVSTNVYLAVGDYVEIYGYQNSGGPQGTAIGATATWFSAILMQRR